MSKINVQYADETASTVIGYAAGQQDPATWQYQGEVDTSDARWRTYFESKDEESKVGLPAPTS
ncbi:hypothetical protein WI93_11765 [Burkholderia vietnamiensis]|uniref:hypothetical protein n=1 Tax=Burkholderia vietnamiensis TaxID=60552 RepID=UPI00075F07CA|nr:hypothetical protein [Burkholderia vietnamiensis]KVE27710.1 hypothetical protein WI93_11765 [Burkholderia vietnamiensis]